MTLSLPPDLYKVLLWLAGIGVAWLWLRKELTARRALSIVESEGVLSTRLILGFAVVVYCMCMVAAGRMANTMLETWLLFAATLLGLGVAKVVSKAFAAAPPATTINSEKTKVDADKVVMNDTPHANQPASE